MILQWKHQVSLIVICKKIIFADSVIGLKTSQVAKAIIVVMVGVGVGFFIICSQLTCHSVACK